MVTGNAISIGQLPSFNFNVMVVGESGCGKTTLCHSVVKKYVPVEYQESYSKQVFQTLSIDEVGNFQLKCDNNQIVFVRFIDSRGYNDFLNNKEAVDKVKSYIQSKHVAWLNLKGQEISDEERNLRDERVHLVFYFFAPHRYKAIDRVFLSELADIVNIVPVIAKSDTMTVDERRSYLKEVRTLLNELHETNGVTIYDFEEELEYGQFIPDDGEKNGDRENENGISLSFPSQASPNLHADVERPGETLLAQTDSVLSNNEEDCDEVLVEENSLLDGSRIFSTNANQLRTVPTTSQQVPVQALPMIKNVFAVSCDNKTGFRVFVYGTIDTENPAHSDFPRLRSLIFEKGHINKLRSKTQQLSNKVCEALKGKPSHYRYLNLVLVGVNGLIFLFVLLACLSSVFGNVSSRGGRFNPRKDYSLRFVYLALIALLALTLLSRDTLSKAFHLFRAMALIRNGK